MGGCCTVIEGFPTRCGRLRLASCTPSATSAPPIASFTQTEFYFSPPSALLDGTASVRDPQKACLRCTLKHLSDLRWAACLGCVDLFFMRYSHMLRYWYTSRRRNPRPGFRPHGATTFVRHTSSETAPIFNQTLGSS